MPTIILMLAAAPASPLLAATLLLWPVQPAFEPGESAAALWVENRGDEATWLQVRVFGWEQRGGENRYHEQQDVISSPPMMQIGPGERHLVRLMRHTSTPAGVESAWRIILDEIPQRRETQTGEQTRAGINLQMRYSLPLFSYGEGLEPITADDPGASDGSQLSWRVVHEEGEALLEVANRGNRHVRLTAVEAVGPGGSVTVAEGLLGYVLPHSHQRWPLPTQAPIETLTARINGQASTIVDRSDDAL